MTFAPTPEQLAIVSAATDTSDNLLISALAGAAKTSTLELIAHALPGVNTLCMAFNKRIADEMSSRLPPHCEARTLNAIGHRAWMQTTGLRLTLDTRKNYKILSECIKRLPKRDQDPAWKCMSEVLDAVGWAKSSGHVPDAYTAHKHTRLMSDRELFDSLPEILSPLAEQLVLEVTLESIKQSFVGIIDFNDQLLMPTVFRATFPIYTLLLVDEAQDLSALNHAIIQKLYRRRIIAVGDQCQAIYGFRGAHEDGMSALQGRFDMKPLTLSCSFRCPASVVRHVKWRAPHMTSWSGAGEGSVTTLHSWDFTDLPEECTVICRNNAPLFTLAVRLLRAGRYPNLWGNDVVQGLLKILKKFGPGNMTQEAVHQSIDEWYDTKAKTSRRLGQLRDRTECLRIFAYSAPTLAEIIEYTTHLMRSTGTVHLMTGHKAKGHEWANVFFLNESLVKDDGQDPNLRYVIATRAKENLVYINMDQCTEVFDDEGEEL